MAKRVNLSADEAIMRCSFCNKSQFEIRRLVAGGLGVICDECVRICVEILEEGPSDAEATAPGAQVGWPGEIYCSLCRAELGDDAIEVENRGLVCTVCAAGVRRALTRRQKAKG